MEGPSQEMDEAETPQTVLFDGRGPDASGSSMREEESTISPVIESLIQAKKEEIMKTQATLNVEQNNDPPFHSRPANDNAVSNTEMQDINVTSAFAILDCKETGQEQNMMLAEKKCPAGDHMEAVTVTKDEPKDDKDLQTRYEMVTSNTSVSYPDVCESTHDQFE